MTDLDSDNACREGPRPRARILVVDDEPLVTTTIQSYLTRQGHDVVTAMDGDEAFVRFLTEGRFDLVLTDVKMPEMDGLQFFQNVKSIDDQTCVVVMTAYPDDERTHELRAVGVEGFLTKPFDLTLLDRLIETTLSRPDERTA